MMTEFERSHMVSQGNSVAFAVSVQNLPRVMLSHTEEAVVTANGMNCCSIELFTNT